MSLLSKLRCTPLGLTAACILAGPTFAADQSVPMDALHALQLLKQHCAGCHNAEDRESGIRVDHLDASFPDARLKLWDVIAHQIETESMPPEGEPQLSPAVRESLIRWIKESLRAARLRPPPRDGSVRRLTVTQYRNTLRDLLGLEEDFTDLLPADGISKDGFTNQSQTMTLSPLLIEAYFEVAQRALNCVADSASVPAIQCFQMDLGDGINPDPEPDPLILGANSHLLDNDDFMVKQLVPDKSFAFKPLPMRTHWEFNEGYQGNDTVRGWRRYDSLYHAVFACMRGTPDYPKGDAFTPVPEGLLLRPAIPSAEIFQIENTYGPRANFKISLRELPSHGRFRVSVTAAKYDDGLLIDETMAVVREDESESIILTDLDDQSSIRVPESGMYQINVDWSPKQPSSQQNPNPKQNPPHIQLKLGERQFSGRLGAPAFLAVRLPAGVLKVSAALTESQQVNRFILTPIPSTHPLADRLERFERSAPLLGVHLGLRRDCGTTVTRVGQPQRVSSRELQTYVFEGAINNFPSPDVQPDNDNYLAGLRDLCVRSEYTDGRDRPRLLLKSIRFEGPFYETWPPENHQALFGPSEIQDPEARARQLIQSFASRAFRRPLSESEIKSLMMVWRDAWQEHHDFQQALKDSYTVVLTSPQFLFLIESSETPEGESLDDYELASKLSYFLWNSPPDETLAGLATENRLHESLTSEVDRMVSDSRFDQFLHEFTSQWLTLDKLDIVETDRERYPELTRDAKKELRREPAEFLKVLFRENLPARHLVQSDFLVANEVVGSYYGKGNQIDSGFEFTVIRHDDRHLGGLLTQAGILAGLSDGREANPVKRGAWLARKIIDQPPDDPPPNVPTLEEDVTGLSLRDRLERHRNQKGCVNCHLGIDPWGFPFEEYDAGGRWNAEVDAHSILPDKTSVRDVNDLKRYLAEDQIDRVAFSFAKHLTIYAIGRDLAYSEIEQLRAACLKLKPQGYGLGDLIRMVVTSEAFLKK